MRGKWALWGLLGLNEYLLLTFVTYVKIRINED